MIDAIVSWACAALSAPVAIAAYVRMRRASRRLKHLEQQRP